jgi:hypothetical protein
LLDTTVILDMMKIKVIFMLKRARKDVWEEWRCNVGTRWTKLNVTYEWSASCSGCLIPTVLTG